MICSRCNNENPEDDLYCGRCGDSLVTGSVVGSTWKERMGIPLMVLGSLLLVLSLLFSITILCMFNIGFMGGDISPLYPVMLLLNLFGPLGMSLVILGTAIHLRGRRIDGDGRGTATILLMGGAVICLLGAIIEITLGNSYLFSSMSFGNLQIGVIGSAVAELGMALFLIGLILWLIRPRSGLHSRSSGE